MHNNSLNYLSKDAIQEIRQDARHWQRFHDRIAGLLLDVQQKTTPWNFLLSLKIQNHTDRHLALYA